jgi:dienelactone hydrolase
LQASDSLVKDEGGVKQYRIRFVSTQKGSATGILFVPAGKGPFAGIVLQHGMPSSAQAYACRAPYLARYGVVVVAIEAPFVRRGGAPPDFTPRDSAEQVHLIIDLQRAVDLLMTRTDVDKSRLAFVGRSFGGVLGVLLAGVERRLKTTFSWSVTGDNSFILRVLVP